MSEFPSHLMNVIEEQLAQNRVVASAERTAYKYNLLPWKHNNRDYRSYEETFCLPQNFLLDVRNEQLERGELPFALDLCASPAMLRSLDLVGFALAWVDPRETDVLCDDIDKGIYMLEGDVLSTKTWNLLENLGPFSLITSAPSGGMLRITALPEVHHAILNNVWGVLATNGTAIVERPLYNIEHLYHGNEQRLYELWFKKAKRVLGDNITETTTALILKKAPDSPTTLPSL